MAAAASMAGHPSKRARRLLRLAQLTRPFMGPKTPGLYRVCQWLLKLAAPKPDPAAACHLVAAYDGGLIQIDTSSSLEYHLLFRGCHEPEITRLIRHVLRPGQTVLDVGANVGVHTLVMARAVGTTGRVVAVEPHPTIGRRLRENVALNGYGWVTVVEAALADRDGSAAFFGFTAGAFHQGISSLRPDADATNRMEVRAVTGRTLVAELGLDACHLVKIDVEGAERLVLAELTDLLTRHRPFLICEYRKEAWEKFGATADDVLATLGALGYRCYTVRRDVTQPLGGALPDSCELFCVPEPGAAQSAAPAHDRASA